MKTYGKPARGVLSRSLALLLSAALALPAAAVGTSNWSHTNEADWKEGTFDNVVATNLGDLKLSRAVKTLLEQDPRVSAVNALAMAPDGTVYAGTGPRGVLLRVKGDAVEEVAKIDDAQIFSVLVGAKGDVLLGTGGERGRVLRINKAGGAPVEVFKAEGVQYVWSIRQTGDGNLYAATGPAGQLFEIKPDGASRVLLDTDENNLLSLISDGKDLLYAGTDPNGLVYRVNRKTGESFILYDAAETAGGTSTPARPRRVKTRPSPRLRQGLRSKWGAPRVARGHPCRLSAPVTRSPRRCPTRAPGNRTRSRRWR